MSMRSNRRQVKNHAGVIICSNHPDPVQLVTSDRRFNVAPPQEHQLRLTMQDIEQVDKEVQSFANYLRGVEVVEQRVREVMMNSSRRSMIDASETSIEGFFTALRNGDLDYFLSYADAEMNAGRATQHFSYVSAIKKWMQALGDRREGRIDVSLGQLLAVYSFIIGTPTSPSKLRRMLAFHRVEFPKSSINHEMWFKGSESSVLNYEKSMESSGV